MIKKDIEILTLLAAITVGLSWLIWIVFGDIVLNTIVILMTINEFVMGFQEKLVEGEGEREKAL